MAPLPAKYLRAHPGDMRAAWAAYRADHPSKGAKRRRSSSSESVVPTPDGGGVTMRSARGLHANIGAHPVVEYDEEAVGMILRGFIAQMRTPAGPDLSGMFPPPADQVDEAAWRRGAQERELGAELFRHMGKALLYFKVRADEWQRGYSDAIRNAGGGSSVNVAPSSAPGLSNPFPWPR